MLREGGGGRHLFDLVVVVGGEEWQDRGSRVSVLWRVNAGLHEAVLVGYPAIFAVAVRAILTALRPTPFACVEMCRTSCVLINGLTEVGGYNNVIAGRSLFWRSDHNRQRLHPVIINQ